VNEEMACKNLLDTYYSISEEVCFKLSDSPSVDLMNYVGVNTKNVITIGDIRSTTTTRSLAGWWFLPIVTCTTSPIEQDSISKAWACSRLDHFTVISFEPSY